MEKFVADPKLVKSSVMVKYSADDGYSSEQVSTMDTPVIEMDDSYEEDDIISLEALAEQEEQGIYSVLEDEE
jgi:hypothetical protein